MGTTKKTTAAKQSKESFLSDIKNILDTARTCLSVGQFDDLMDELEDEILEQKMEHHIETWEPSDMDDEDDDY